MSGESSNSGSGASSRPGAIRTETVHPALKPEVTNIPVTPGINEETYNNPESVGSPRNVTSYFSADLNKLRSGDMAQEGQEILRRLSLSGQHQRKDSLSDTDPKGANPALGLSGGVISATFCIPYSLKHRKGADWEMHERRGTSALFDSFAHLSSENTPWNHTLVGWTGEIKQVADVLSPPDTPPATTTTSKYVPLNKASAPIPVDAGDRPPTPQQEGHWISMEDRESLERQLLHDKKCKTLPVWLADEVQGADGELLLKDQAKWRRYAEHELYPLFHYKMGEPSDGRAERKSWTDYYRMNQKFANRILEVYKPGDIVMIHDYHLLLLPSLLRQKVPHMYIGFFLHVPFPSSEFLRCLPRRKEILEGVLGANLVGFQSFSYSRHFASCCTRILGFPSDVTGVDAYGIKVAVGVFPIGIDAAGVEKLAFDEKIDEQATKLREYYPGVKIIVGRDRLDSVRGVPQKLMAFERFLEMYPEWREKVVLIQVTSPTSIEEQKEDSNNKVANKVSELVSSINGLYGSLGFAPVQHFPQFLPQDEYLALLRCADIGLITSVRDGMNTTSLEYVVCQRDSHGPIILSEFSGTAGSLRDAIHINPWDLSGVAEQINHALTMSPERRQIQHHSLYQHVTRNNVQAWSSGYLKRLLTVLSSQNKENATPLLDRTKLLSRYKKSKKRLFMFDYDGTLTPIVQDPSAAIPTTRIRNTIKELADDPQNDVWIISGRDQEFLGTHLGDIERLGFSAEHGSFIRHPGSKEWENLAEKFDLGWQKEVMDVFQKFTDQTHGSFIERKRCALTWHYRRADPELGAHNARACQTELEQTVGKKWDVEVMTGKANLEVRPTFINKGEIAKRLVNDEIERAGAPEFVLCLGDDFTDEDMFRALNGAVAEDNMDEESVFTVTVGASSKMTLAKWHVLEPSDVIDVVGLLNGGAKVADLGVLQQLAEAGKVDEEIENF